MTTPAEYENLLRTGSFKESISDADSIDQFLRNADELLAGAGSSMPDSARFILAYEGMFNVVMAVLEFHGVRPGDGGGHRTTAIQRVATDLKLDSNRQSALARLHDIRNRVTYRKPLPPVTRADADAMRLILQQMLAATKTLLRN